MKKIFNFVFMAAAAIAAMSCIKEENPVGPGQNGELVHMTFTATADAETKVVFTDGATVWTEGDKIMVIAESGKAYEFEATSVDGANAIFEGDAEPSEKYYAVSPASAYVGNDIANEKIYTNIPEKQTATAGTFDPKAFLSVAQNDGTSLYFKNSCSVVGFKLDNPVGVKSVRFIVNGETNIAGTGAVITNNIPVQAWDGTYEGRSAFNMITLNAPNGGFSADTEYFLTIRANNCPKGITVYVEYEDQVKSRASENVLFDGQNYRNQVRRLGVLDQNLTDVTPYDRYQLGFDLEVAGKTINKTANGAATLISTADQVIASNGVYFINSDVKATLNPASGHYTALYVLGNNPSVKSQMAVGGNVRWTTNGVIALKGLEVLDESNNTMFQSNGANGTLVIDGCALPTTTSTQMIYIGHQTTELAIYNSDFKITKTGRFVINGNNQIIQTCTMENNIVYSPEEDIAQFKFITNTPTLTTLNFNKNTVANVFSSTTSNEDYFKVGAIETFNCNNNLFYLPNYSDGRYLYIVKVIPSNVNQTNNLLHKTASTNSRMRVIYEGNPKVADVWVTTKKIESDVVTSVDLANGVIVPATTAGATR